MLRRYRHLYHDMERWREHLQSPPDPAEPDGQHRKSLLRLFGIPLEILDSPPTPLAAILERNRPDAAADSQPGF